MYILQAVVELLLLCYDATSSAKHTTKGGKVTGHENKNVTLHRNIANATTSDKEGTARTVKEGCEDTTSTMPYVPERVGLN